MYLLVRFARPLQAGAPRPSPGRLLVPLGLAAGFLDATGGGGWGAVATPYLLVSKRLAVRKVIGSVDAAECMIAGSASAGFVVGMGTAGFVVPIVVAVLAGGVLAAPVAAWLVRKVPAQLLGAGVGGLIVITNAHALAGLQCRQRQPLVRLHPGSCGMDHRGRVGRPGAAPRPAAASAADPLPGSAAATQATTPRQCDTATPRCGHPCAWPQPGGAGESESVERQG